MNNEDDDDNDNQWEQKPSKQSKNWKGYHKSKQTGLERRKEPGIAKLGALTKALKEPPTLPTRFVPRFWRDADQRVHCVKIIRKRLNILLEHCGGSESIQRDLICQRLAFLSIILESREVSAVEGDEFEIGAYVQSVNAMVGLLKTVGLDKRIKSVQDLQTLLAEENE